MGDVDVAFRPADPRDVDAVVALMQLYYAEDGYPFIEEQARTAVARLVGDAALGRLWVIEADGVSIGYVVLTLGYSLEYHGRDAFLDELFVASAWRGRGLGARALALVERTCRTLGVTALHLEVERDKQQVQAFYRRAGFVDHGRYLLTKRLPAQTGQTDR
jgi:GNAT superfamily N-acetyltransferase